MEPASVGIVLDSSVIIADERSGHTVREILEQVKEAQGEIEIGIPVVTIAQLVHGAYRAKPKRNSNIGWSSSSDYQAMCRYIR